MSFIDSGFGKVKAVLQKMIAKPNPTPAMDNGRAPWDAGRDAAQGGWSDNGPVVLRRSENAGGWG